MPDAKGTLGSAAPITAEGHREDPRPLVDLQARPALVAQRAVRVTHEYPLTRVGGFAQGLIRKHTYFLEATMR